MFQFRTRLGKYRTPIGRQRKSRPLYSRHLYPFPSIGRQRKNTTTHNRQAHLPLQTKEIIFSGGK